MASVEIRRFVALLKKNGQFVTKPRRALFSVLQDHRTLSIEQLITLLVPHDAATVYRNIKLFEELGIISRLQLGWHSKLELSDRFQHHHHHLTCTTCGRILILSENTVIESEIQRLTQKLHFTPTDHQLEIRGLCSECQPTTASK